MIKEKVKGSENAVIKTNILPGSFDEVGQYDQDKINGFDNELIFSFIEHANLLTNSKVLDYMCGNGNLTNNIINFYPEHSKEIEFHCLDIASEQLRHSGFEDRTEYNITLHSADATKGMPFFENDTFSRIIRKSASHELQLEDHLKALEGTYRILDKGGKFADMGFLFEDKQERDEFRELARKKDSLAQLTELEKNRHFLTKDEMYNLYKGAGYKGENIEIVSNFNYNVDSSILCEAYFKDKYENYKAYQDEFDSYCMNTLHTLVDKNMLKQDEGRIWIKAPGAMIIAKK